MGLNCDSLNLIFYRHNLKSSKKEELKNVKMFSNHLKILG